MSCKIDSCVGNKWHIGNGELDNTVKWSVGNPISNGCLLQTEQEPTIVILFNVIGMDDNSGLFPIIRSIQKIQRLMVDGTVNEF